MPMEENEKYMMEALREAHRAAEEDEVPVGAVIVCRGKIIGKGHNMTERLCDPTAHARFAPWRPRTCCRGGKVSHRVDRDGIWCGSCRKGVRKDGFSLR